MGISASLADVRSVLNSGKCISCIDVSISLSVSPSAALCDAQTVDLRAGRAEKGAESALRAGSAQQADCRREATPLQKGRRAEGSLSGWGELRLAHRASMRAKYGPSFVRTWAGSLCLIVSTSCVVFVLSVSNVLRACTDEPANISRSGVVIS